MVALVLGTITFTIALLLMPVSLRYLSSNTNPETFEVPGKEDWGVDRFDGDFGFSSQSMADSVGVVQDAVPGVTNKTIGTPTLGNSVAAAGGRNGLDQNSRNDVVSFQSTVGAKPWSMIGGYNDSLDLFAMSPESATASIQLARATAENTPATIAQGSGPAVQSGSPEPVQANDTATQTASTAASTKNTESPGPGDKATVQSLVEVRNKSTMAFARMLDSGFYAGYESDYLWLLNKSSMGLRLSQLNDQSIAVSPADSYGPGGRIWIGMRAAERGIRATYSFYNGQNQDESPAGGMQQFLSHASAVHDLQTFDIEVTQPFRLAGFGLEVTAGARHLQYQGIDSLFVLAEPTSDLHAVGTANATNDLSALGFTGSIHGKSVLPSKIFGDLLPFLHDDCDMSGCYTRRSFWYWDARASALWGESKAAALTSAAVSVNNPSGAVGYAASRDFAMATNASESMLGSLELQLGVEHRRRLFMFPNADLVFRSGIEFRRFSLGRSFASAKSFAFMRDDDDAFGLRLDTYADSQDRVLRMFGLVFAVGANF